MNDLAATAIGYAPALRRWLGRPVWATVIASIGLLAVHAGAVGLTLGGVIPLWAGVICCFFCAHAGFTILHEASHRTISGGARGLEWLDALLGTLHAAVLLYDFPTFRYLHLRHHANTNDPAADPDFWMQRHGPLMVLLRALFIPMHYLRLYLEAARRGTVRGPAARMAMLRIAILIAIMLSVLMLMPLHALALWIVPASIASALLSLSHRMMHSAEVSADRRRTTRLIIAEGFWEWLMCPLFWLNNHHLIHHESPRLPVISHREVYSLVEPQLRAGGMQIVRFGAPRRDGRA